MGHKCEKCLWRNDYPVYSGKKYACHLSGHNVFKDGECVLPISEQREWFTDVDNEGGESHDLFDSRNE